MTPFHKLAHDIGKAKGFLVSPKSRPFSGAEVMRVRLARYLRWCHDAGITITDIVATLHAEPAESDWCPGYGDEKADDRRSDPCSS